MNSPRPQIELSLAERIFLRFFCYSPPPAPFEPRDSIDPSKSTGISNDPLGLTRRVFGDAFESAIKGRTLLDIGCGPGDQVLGAVQAGARLAVGVDKNEVMVRLGEINAEKMGLSERARFTMDAVSTLGTEWADVALSQNSFEHFHEPERILAQAFEALKPGGQFFVTFGPPWWHPFGVHHMFMIKLPWAHYLFSERTILRVRQLFRPNRPTRWLEVSLNQMTIAKLLRLVADSGFSLARLSVTPIGPLPGWLVRQRPFREWTVSDVSVILAKPPN